MVKKSYLLDTNAIAAHLKKDVRVTYKLAEVRRLGEEAFISGISYYEVKRGLLAVNATAKMAAFNDFCKEYKVLSGAFQFCKQ